VHKNTLHGLEIPHGVLIFIFIFAFIFSLVRLSKASGKAPEEETIKGPSQNDVDSLVINSACFTV